MKPATIILAFTLTATLLFNLLFWQEDIGLNLLIFDAVIILMICKLYPDSLRRPSSRWILLGHAFAVAMVMINNSLLSKVVAGGSLFLFAAFAEYIHRSAVFAAGSIFFQTTFLVAEFTELLVQSRSKTAKKKRSYRLFKIVFAPLALLILFFVIYTNANAAFADLTSKFTHAIDQYFSKLFALVSWDRILFIVLGLYVSGSLLIKSRMKILSERESAMQDSLVRKKVGAASGNFLRLLLSLIPGAVPKGMLALKSKATMGLISLVLLNILLLAINITDIVYVWTVSDYGVNEPASALLHEGTGVLIFSIVLAISVVLFFFDGNINFYKRSKLLRIAAMIWLVQNVFLTASVFMRDYYYISLHGLAYKRIAVLFFLSVVIVGLISVMIKIRLRKSNYFLFRVNSNALVVIFIIASAVNWDVFIAEYNLSKMATIKPDTEFLLNLSDKVLPVLQTHRVELEAATANKIYAVPVAHEWYKNRMSFGEYLDVRQQNFAERYQSHSWLSWNLADAKVNAGISAKQTVKR